MYATSKAAVRSFARTLAADDTVLTRGIRVNEVSPGAIHTPLTAQEDAPAPREAVDAYVAV